MSRILRTFLWVTLCACTFSATAQTWVPIGPNDNNRPSDVGGDWISSVLSPMNNNIYIAYSDATNANNGILVRQWNGSQWTDLGSPVNSVSGGYGYTDIAIHPITGELYAGLVSNIGSNVMSVHRYTGGVWQAVGNTSAIALNFCRKVKIAFDAAGNLFTGFLDYDNVSGRYYPKVFAWNGSSWNSLGNLENVIAAGNSISTDYFTMEMSPAGTLFVSYLLNDNVAFTNLPEVRKWNGSNWVTVGSTAAFAQYRGIQNMAIGADDAPYVLGTYEPTSPYCFCATVKKLNTTTNAWEQVGNASIIGTAYGLYDYEYSDIKLDPLGTPYIAIKQDFTAGNPYRISVMRFTGGTWQAVGSPNFSIGPPDHISLLFNSSGQPVVFMSDRACGSATPNTVVNDLVQAYQFNGTAWQLMGNNGISSAGMDHFSFSIDKNKNIYAVGCIHSFSAVGNEPHVYRWNGTAWSNAGTTQPVFNEPAYYSISSAVDDAGNLFIAYRNSSIGGYAVRKYTQSTNTWSAVGNNITSSYYIYNTTLMVDGSNRPVVSASNVSGIPSVFRFDGSTWQTLSGSGLISTSGQPTLLRGKGGAVLLAMGSSGIISIKKYNETAGNWNVLSSTTIAYSNFAVDTTGVTDTIYAARVVAPGASGYIQVFKTYDGGSFTQVGGNFSPPALTGSKVSLAIGAGNVPQMIYGRESFKMGTARFNRSTNAWEVITSPLANGLGQADDGQLRADNTGEIYGMYNSSFLYLKKLQTSVLPLRSIQASAAVAPNGVLVRWNWEDDNDTRVFGVESSTDGLNFTSIASLTPTGNGRRQLQHLHTTAVNGKLFYRIKGVSNNGRIVYSNIVSIITDKEIEVVLQQNTVTGQLVFYVSSNPPQTIQYRITNMSGQLFQQGQFKTGNGPVKQTVNTAPLAAGMYLLQVQSQQGASTPHRFVKQAVR
jgi:hypothetical protein